MGSKGKEGGAREKLGSGEKEEGGEESVPESRFVYLDGGGEKGGKRGGRASLDAHLSRYSRNRLSHQTSPLSTSSSVRCSPHPSCKTQRPSLVRPR